MTGVIGAVTEIFTWVGLALAAPLLVGAIIARVADGTWHPATAYLVGQGDGRHLRWFGRDGVVGEAPLTPEIDRAAGGRDQVDIHVSERDATRVRLAARSTLPGFLFRAGIAAVALGVVAAAVQLAMVWVQTSS